MNLRALLPLVFSLAAAGCASKSTQPAGSQPPIVTVSQPLKRKVTDYIDYTGRTEAINAVDIRARVTGYLVKMPFKEGDELKQGDLLFEIDPRPYQAQLDQAQANVLLNKAQLKLTKANNARAKIIAKTPGAISQQDLDQYQAAEEEAAAQVDRGRGLAGSLSTEPRVLRSHVPDRRQSQPLLLHVGQPGHAGPDAADDHRFSRSRCTPISTSTSGPCFAMRDMINERKLKAVSSPEEIPLLMGLQDEAGFPHEGHVNFINNTVDPFTGTITFRGVFDNPKPTAGVRVLSPGMFVRVRIPLGEPHEALLVNDRAVGTDQGLKFLFVVNMSDNQIEYRRVSLGPLQDDGLRVIDSGIEPDDWIVVSGLQQLRPGWRSRPSRCPCRCPRPRPRRLPRRRRTPRRRRRVPSRMRLRRAKAPPGSRKPPPPLAPTDNPAAEPRKP